MNYDEYLSYTSEINMLEDILEKIPVDNLIERATFEERLLAIKSEMEMKKQQQET